MYIKKFGLSQSLIDTVSKVLGNKIDNINEEKEPVIPPLRAVKAPDKSYYRKKINSLLRPSVRKPGDNDNTEGIDNELAVAVKRSKFRIAESKSKVQREIADADPKRELRNRPKGTLVAGKTQQSILAKRVLANQRRLSGFQDIDPIGAYADKHGLYDKWKAAKSKSEPKAGKGAVDAAMAASGHKISVDEPKKVKPKSKPKSTAGKGAVDAAMAALGKKIPIDTKKVKLPKPRNPTVSDELKAEPKAKAEPVAKSVVKTEPKAKAEPVAKSVVNTELKAKTASAALKATRTAAPLDVNQTKAHFIRLTATKGHQYKVGIQALRDDSKMRATEIHHLLTHHYEHEGPLPKTKAGMIDHIATLEGKSKSIIAAQERKTPAAKKPKLEITGDPEHFHHRHMSVANNKGDSESFALHLHHASRKLDAPTFKSLTKKVTGSLPDKPTKANNHAHLKAYFEKRHKVKLVEEYFDSKMYDYFSEEELLKIEEIVEGV